MKTLYIQWVMQIIIALAMHLHRCV